MEDFRTFIARREEAARAFCRGDVSRVVDLSARTDPATFFGPDGKVVEGAEAVRKDYQSASGAFGPGGDCGFEVMQMTSDGDLGFWTGLQMAEVEVGGNRMPMTLRVTEVFRRENGNWTLIHRHADAQKPAT
ncbi:nuclear transport factor 2 family protein [Chelativorans sp. J32]|uniref:YybH family protein n=1 Tax=Chelativorans sp. J32 TaxID=935840 RepID=UPI0004B74C17|nr:nuclear transport factor 2 family protein [Chelativorans sp. J32]